MSFDVQRVIPDDASVADLRRYYARARCMACERIWGLLVPCDDRLRLFQPPKRFRLSGSTATTIDADITISSGGNCRWVGDGSGRQAVQCACGRRRLLDLELEALDGDQYL